MIELKPCPFCGGKAKLMQREDLWSVSCADCGSGTALSGSRDRTVEVWNKRTSGWISVRDRLPEEIFGESETVLVIAKMSHLGISGYSENYYLAWTVNREWMGCKGTVTHWMPLPDPPEGEK